MMENNMGDPFYAARDEVQANFAELQRLQHEWKQQLQTRGHIDKCSRQAAAASPFWLNEGPTARGDFFEEIEQKQQTLVMQQDQQLEELATAATRLHETALTINQELETQQRMLTDLDDTVERQDSRSSKKHSSSSSSNSSNNSIYCVCAAASQMNFLMRRLAKVVRSSDTRQLWTIVWLFCIAVALFVLLIIS
ncbi:syntaxin family protein, putative [Eimeria maxima]|uniref:Syntaxin family protein, putative n=1 Tax=Eimeria maxima TaxID=5804 RepID=U6M1E6_EIMMA|nr:syntaxin family protein, putative [Eimeria maxima]CDJ58022.1 syntaxin family protein, putative [Eimeria maxima]